YGSAQDNGGPFSDPNLLNNGNLSWRNGGGDATGVATDQTGHGTLYQYWWPCCGGRNVDFFQVNGVGETNGLLLASNGLPTPDPQWPSTGGSTFAVNPINRDQVIMSSIVSGRLFRMENATQVNPFWSIIAQPTQLDGTYVQAPAFGAPDPFGPEG